VDLTQLLLDCSESGFEGFRVGDISCKSEGARQALTRVKKVNSRVEREILNSDLEFRE